MPIPFRKGQMSLEFLLIFAIFLSVLAIFLVSFSKTKNQTEHSLNKIIISKLENDFSYIINSICILGDGNVREFSSDFLAGALLFCNKNIISISFQNITHSIEVNCDTVCASSIGNKLKIENKNGTVFVS